MEKRTNVQGKNAIDFRIQPYHLLSQTYSRVVRESLGLQFGNLDKLTTDSKRFHTFLLSYFSYWTPKLIFQTTPIVGNSSQCEGRYVDKSNTQPNYLSTSKFNGFIGKWTCWSNIVCLESEQFYEDAGTRNRKSSQWPCLWIEKENWSITDCVESIINRRPNVTSMSQMS